MPTLFSAKDIVEEALKKIGRFPPTATQADAQELMRGLRMLELIGNDSGGQQSMIGQKGTLQVPLFATVQSYPLKNLGNKDGVQIVFDAELLEVASGRTQPLEVIEEEAFFKLNLQEPGRPCRIYINKGPEEDGQTLQVNPVLGPLVPDGTFRILLQIQTFFTQISQKSGAPTLNLRPTFYLWAINKLAYELGTGTIVRLPDGELTRFKADYEEKESRLVGFDGSDNSNQPFTEPWGQ